MKGLSNQVLLSNDKGSLRDISYEWNDLYLYPQECTRMFKPKWVQISNLNFFDALFITISLPNQSPRETAGPSYISGSGSWKKQKLKMNFGISNKQLIVAKIFVEVSVF